MELVAKFTGNTIEGNFESANENLFLLNKIKEDYYTAEKQFQKDAENEIGIKSEIKKESFVPVSKKYTNIDEIKKLALKKLQSSEFEYTKLDDTEIYETNTHKAIISLGKDLGEEIVNNFTTVEIHAK